jgi:hypothetical protein
MPIKAFRVAVNLRARSLCARRGLVERSYQDAVENFAGRASNFPLGVFWPRRQFVGCHEIGKLLMNV